VRDIGANDLCYPYPRIQEHQIFQPEPTVSSAESPVYSVQRLFTSIVLWREMRRGDHLPKRRFAFCEPKRFKSGYVALLILPKNEKIAKVSNNNEPVRAPNIC
jgi:hypothetical protein